MARIITRMNVGGPAIQALLLHERLDPDRYEPLLITGRPGPHEGDMLALRGSHVRPRIVDKLARDLDPVADIRALTVLTRELRRFRPDVVHTHLSKAGALGRIAARLAGAPVVVHTFHGNILQGYFGGRTTALFLGIERALARASTRIIAISALQRRELERLGIGTDRIVEVPLGFDLSPFLSAQPGGLRRELGIAADAPIVGIVARLVPIKAVDVFLHAAADLAETMAAHFVVVGDGELREGLETLAGALQLGDRVHFLGWRSDLPAIYRDLDVVVQSSVNEGTPVSIIEALASSRPVVATAVGGVPDVVDEATGTLVTPGEPHAIADAVRTILADPRSAAKRARLGQERVLHRHDASALVARIDAVYTELVSERSKM